jgi:hypothetical protein
MKTVFVFGIEGLEANEKGEFTLNGKLFRRVYNNGTIQIRCGKFSKSLKHLRKLAVKKQVEDIKLPF